MRRSPARTSISGALALACAGLLIAGCDYWKNLTEEKTRDKAASLTILALDVFTKDTLRVSCTEPEQGFSDSSADSAVIFHPDAPTGRYTLHCSASGDSAYYECSKTFDVRPGAQTRVIMEMARKGGELWYPNLRVEAKPGSLRYRVPETVSVVVTPYAAGDSLFRYQWSSAYHVDLNLTTLQNTLSIPLRKEDIGPQRLTLDVWATPPGIEPYLVGSDTILDREDFVRNIPPRFFLEEGGAAFTPDHFYKVGCGEVPLVFRYNALDPDGNCSVRFVSLDSNSSLGRLDTTIGCSNKNTLQINLPLRTPLQPERLPTKLTEHLSVGVKDDNGERYDTVLTFPIAIARPPSYFRFERVSRKVQFVKIPVEIRFVGHDSDAPFSLLHVNWGDSTELPPIYVNRNNDLLDSARHSYMAPGTYSVRASVTDECGSTAGPLLLDPITVIDNTKPALDAFYSTWVGPVTLNLRMSISDRDMTELLADSLHLLIDWKDGTPNTDTVFSCCAPVEDRIFSHDFARPQTEDHTVAVAVFDAHKGFDTAHVMISKP
jgi:hypothetical protein